MGSHCERATVMAEGVEEEGEGRGVELPGWRKWLSNQDLYKWRRLQRKWLYFCMCICVWCACIHSCSHVCGYMYVQLYILMGAYNHEVTEPITLRVTYWVSVSCVSCWTWSLSIQMNLTSQLALGMAHLCFLRAGVTGLVYNGFERSRTSAFRLIRPSLCLWSHLYSLYSVCVLLEF